jgi:putative ABC transport system ATP-binding protein
MNHPSLASDIRPAHPGHHPTPHADRHPVESEPERPAAPPAEAVIKAQGVNKTYGKGENAFNALQDVSLEIGKGEAVAIVGKSGSGKSTLMHLLALMDKPTNGAIFINGQDTSHMKGKELSRLRNQAFGFVFQQFFLNGNSSVLDNVILPLKIAGVGGRERKDRALKALEAVELQDKAKNKARDLSGGQKQRVVLARAIVNQPTIIFADEPTGNLDTATGQVIEDLLFELNRTQGITLVIVTHDPDLSQRCDRSIYIQDGQIVEGGRS